MNELQLAIQVSNIGLARCTAEQATKLRAYTGYRSVIEHEEAKLARVKAGFISMGIEGKNAEERAANLAQLMDGTDNELRQCQREFEAMKLELDIATLYHQQARYTLNAAIAIAEARDV